MSTAAVRASHLKHTGAQLKILRREVRVYLDQINYDIAQAHAIGQKESLTVIARQFGIQCMQPDEIEREVLSGILHDVIKRGFHPTLQFMHDEIYITISWFSVAERDDIRAKTEMIARYTFRKN